MTVTNTGAFAGAPILLMKDATGKVLWAWTFWNIAADGTKLDPVTVGKYGFAPMDIGGHDEYGDLDKRISLETTRIRDFTGSLCINWGRPPPMFWTRLLVSGYD